MEVQSVVFPSKEFTSLKARSWLRKMKLKPIKRVHKYANTLRYRIQDPDYYTDFRTKKLENGINLVLGSK